MPRRRSVDSQAKVTEEAAAAAPAKVKRTRTTALKTTRRRAPKVEPVSAPVDENEIAHLAYALWEARGRPDGSPDEDWFRAMEEVRTRQSAG